MATQIQQAERFLALHRQPQPLLLPNPWDLGSAKLLAWLGFSALATTSSGFAATVGRLDGQVTRDEAIDHAAAVVRATDLPVSADLENGFSDTAAGVAETGSVCGFARNFGSVSFLGFWSTSLLNSAICFTRLSVNHRR